MAYQSRTASGLDTQRGEAWDSKAACRDVDPEIFFADSRSPEAAIDRADAIATCRRCNVQRQCGEWVRDNPQEFGVWAGLTPSERRAAWGAALPAAPVPRVAVCPQEHEFTPENTYVSPDGKRHCRTCKNNRNSRSKRAGRANIGKLACYAGHPFNAENTYVDSLGRRNCRICRAATAARYRARLEEKAAVS